MATATATRIGRYLYAVIDAAEDRTYGDIGIDGGTVYAISDGRVAAVVSDAPNEKIRPERRRLAAHHQVLKRLMEEHAVLPMAFGIIADGPKAIRKILSLNQAAFAEQVRRTKGRVEMGLRVFWDVPNIFEYFVNTHAELKALRDDLYRGGREPSQNDKIELGRMFDRLLNEDRAAHAERVVNVLSPRCVEIKENKLPNEREVMNLACLIARNAQKEFEQGVLEAAKLFDNNYSFDFNGPWPPHNFVTMELKM